MPKKPTPPAAVKRGRGRPKSTEPAIPVVGFRIPQELLARLDGVTERRNARLAAQGAKTTRQALMILALSEYCDRDEAEAARPPAGPA